MKIYNTACNSNIFLLSNTYYFVKHYFSLHDFNHFILEKHTFQNSSFIGEIMKYLLWIL